MSQFRARVPAPMSGAPAYGLARVGLAYVDDSETARCTLQRAMRVHGIELETFGSPRAFLGRSTEALIGAVLDVDLGSGPDGFELAQALRQRDPSIAIAFFTSDTSPERLARLAPLGKVFTKGRDLPAVVDWLLALAAAPRAAAI